MRTTLTLEADVAAMLKRAMKARRSGLKQTVNDALRAGLGLLLRAERPKSEDPTRPVDLGACLVGSIDDVSDVLAIAEGETHR